MAEPTDAAGEAPQAPQTEQTPTQTNNEPAQAPAPNLYGFTEEQLKEMSDFYTANGGYEKGFKRVKSAISNPQPSEKPAQKPVEASQSSSEPQKAEEPTSHTEGAPEPPKTPQGAITAQEFLAEQYFKSLAGEEKYAPISEGIRNGDYLKEMAAFGIKALNQDGSINDQKVRMYLDLKAQTVPAKPTETEPNASTAPTVDYVSVGEKIESLDQAYQVIMQSGHPRSKDAEEFIKNNLNSQKK